MCLESTKQRYLFLKAFEEPRDFVELRSAMETIAQKERIITTGTGPRPLMTMINESLFNDTLIVIGRNYSITDRGERELSTLGKYVRNGSTADAVVGAD